jgi:hypothetical protein
MRTPTVKALFIINDPPLGRLWPHPVDLRIHGERAHGVPDRMVCP